MTCAACRPRAAEKPRLATGPSRNDDGGASAAAENWWSRSQDRLGASAAAQHRPLARSPHQSDALAPQRAADGPFQHKRSDARAIFISYSHHDRDWLRAPAREAARKITHAPAPGADALRRHRQGCGRSATLSAPWARLCSAGASLPQTVSSRLATATTSPRQPWGCSVGSPRNAPDNTDMPSHR